VTHAPPGGYARPPAPPPVTPGGHPLAEFGDRAVAFIIDTAILSGAALVLVIPVVVYQLVIIDDWVSAAAENEPPDGAMVARLLSVFVAYLLVFLLMLGVYYVYRVEMMFRSGQTVGKRVMRIKVVPLDPRLILTRGIATRRWLVDSVGVTLVPLLFWIDGLWQYWDQPYRQCLHDKVAGTTVVKALP
jgi:uncharacterized RDD family membrane protein YckC